MKKIKLLILTPLLLSVSLSSYNLDKNGLGIASNINRDANENLSLTDSQALSIKTFFNSAYQITSDINTNYSTKIDNFTVIEQIDKTNRTSIIKNAGTTIQEMYLTRGTGDAAILQYLAVNNTVTDKNLTDSDSNIISYDKYYGSPFRYLGSLTTAKLNSYFTMTSSEDSYILKATDYGYGALEIPFCSFLFDYDSFNWDSSSTSYYIKDLTITINSDGTPTAYNVTRIKKDRYGAIKDVYTSTLKAIESVSKLSPVNSSMTESQETEYTEKMATLKTNILKGNFTENIDMTYNEGTSALKYANYYALESKDSTATFPPMMLSSMELTDSSAGKTYVGIAYDTDGNLARIGISPSSDTYQALNSVTYTKLSEVLPYIYNIGAGYLSYDEKTGYYTFDIGSFLYGDYAFCYAITEALFGPCDYGVANGGLFQYVSSTSYYFGKMKLKFESNGDISGSLEHYVYYSGSSYLYTTNFSFTEFGKTDLEKVDDIADAVNYVKAQ